MTLLGAFAFVASATSMHGVLIFLYCEYSLGGLFPVQCTGDCWACLAEPNEVEGGLGSRFSVHVFFRGNRRNERHTRQ